MKSLISFLACLSLVGTLSAQTIVLDTLKNKKILVGSVTCGNIADSAWYKKNYNEEPVTVSQLKKIDKYSDSVTVDVYFGTWCDDSRYWVPAFIGLLDKTNLADKITLIAVPRSKKTPETKKLEEIIERVPTFIFWRNGKKIGRIVETPEESLVADIIRILKS